jgi:hypothetical protein
LPNFVASDQPRRHVGGAARGKGDNDLDRPFRIFGKTGTPGQRQQRRQCDHQQRKQADQAR